MRDAVESATLFIRERYAEPLTLADMAEAAIMSRFHFSRLFTSRTGISPGRFLTAVRLHEAKRLLLTTSISVADISCLVGYTSLGTFTTRFTESVGVSPGKFRRLAELGLLGPVPASAKPVGRPSGAVTGTVHLACGASSGPIFMGLFDRPIPQGQPAACLMMPAAGDWLMDGVPEGTWFVLAVTPQNRAHEPADSPVERPMLIGGHGPVDVNAGGLCNVHLAMRAPRSTDPPVLLTLPSLLNLGGDFDPELGNVEEDAAV
jgi:AraC family transcriptional regulator